MDPTLILEASIVLQDQLALLTETALEVDIFDRVSSYRGP